ncbi:hypothetical protein WAI453_011826 [Rhynchosporium graminicola]
MIRTIDCFDTPQTPQGSSLGNRLSLPDRRGGPRETGPLATEIIKVTKWIQQFCSLNRFEIFIAMQKRGLTRGKNDQLRRRSRSSVPTHVIEGSHDFATVQSGSVPASRIPIQKLEDVL